MRRAFGAFLVMALVAGPALAQEKKPYQGFDPKRDAARDLREGIAAAKKANKRVLIDIGGNWCPWCRKLDEFFDSDKEARTLRDAKFVTVKVNWSPENKNEKVLAPYPKIPSFPHLFVLDKNGKFLYAQDTGELESGDHHDHDKVMAFLKKWSG